jgi:hypothetical protein
MIKPRQLTGGFSRTPHALDSLMDTPVIDWLQTKQRELLIDYVNIKYCWNDYGISDLSDYAYLVAPAYKALEGVLIQIAKELGLPDRPYRIGAVYDEDALDKFYADVLDRIGKLTLTERQDVKLWLDDAQRILKHYRHSPAHFQSESKTHWDRAFQLGDQIVHVVNQMCGTLLGAGLIGKRPKPPEERTATIVA